MDYTLEYNFVFQSTPPSLAETNEGIDKIAGYEISIHSAIASGDHFTIRKQESGRISIHSAIASGDEFAHITAYKPVISIHSAIASGD